MIRTTSPRSSHREIDPIEEAAIFEDFQRSPAQAQPVDGSGRPAADAARRDPGKPLRPSAYRPRAPGSLLFDGSQEIARDIS